MSDTIKDIEAVNPSAAEDENIKALSSEVDTAEALAIFANSSQGKIIIADLKIRAYNTLNELFGATRTTPDISTILGIVARLEVNIQMLVKFVGAEFEADQLLSLLQGALKKKIDD